MTQNTGETPARALLIGFHTQETAQACATSLAELKELVGNLDIETADMQVIKLRGLSHKFAMGSGKAEEMMALAKELGCDLIIFDQTITPAQQRNWEKACDLTVADRHEVILDIFARRARTREAALQVELARLDYELPRLKRAWTHLSRQRGGGVTQRGEGETQLQLDRRSLRARIARLREELAQVVKQRAVQRQKRERIPLPSAAIVGYTNAGKSSLLNCLTQAGVLAADKLFATLDPTTRRLDLPSGQPLLLTDTVGFVRRLPHRLVEAFKATLEETLVSDFLIHVVDISHPQADDQARTTCAVLKELGAHEKPMVTVYNKVDCVDDALLLAGLRADDEKCVFVSAKTGEGIGELIDVLTQFSEEAGRTAEVLLPHTRYDLLGKLHKAGLVLIEEARDEGVYLRVQMPARWVDVLKPFLTDSALLQGQGCLAGLE